MIVFLRKVINCIHEKNSRFSEFFRTVKTFKPLIVYFNYWHYPSENINKVKFEAYILKKNLKNGILQKEKFDEYLENEKVIYLSKVYDVEKSEEFSRYLNTNNLNLNYDMFYLMISDPYYYANLDFKINIPEKIGFPEPNLEDFGRIKDEEKYLELCIDYPVYLKYLNDEFEKKFTFHLFKTLTSSEIEVTIKGWENKPLEYYINLSFEKEKFEYFVQYMIDRVNLLKSPSSEREIAYFEIDMEKLVESLKNKFEFHETIEPLSEEELEIENYDKILKEIIEDYFNIDDFTGGSTWALKDFAIRGYFSNVYPIEGDKIFQITFDKTSKIYNAKEEFVNYIKSIHENWEHVLEKVEEELKKYMEEKLLEIKEDYSIKFDFDIIENKGLYCIYVEYPYISYHVNYQNIIRDIVDVAKKNKNLIKLLLIGKWDEFVNNTLLAIWESIIDNTELDDKFIKAVNTVEDSIEFFFKNTAYQAASDYSKPKETLT